MTVQKVYQSVPLDTGDEARILEKKEKFDQEEQKFSKEIYTIDKKDGYKLIVKMRKEN